MIDRTGNPTSPGQRQRAGDLRDANFTRGLRGVNNAPKCFRLLMELSAHRCVQLDQRLSTSTHWGG